MIALTLKSHYSFMWGTACVKQLCRQARAYGYQKIALTDTDNLCGMWPFINACRHHGLTPVIGAELTDPHTAHRAVCLVKNSRGYSNLTRLITQRHMNKNFSLKTTLPYFSSGLLVLTKNQDLLPFWHENSLDLAVNLPRNPLSQHHPLCIEARKLSIPVVATPGSFFLHKKDIKIHRMLRAIDKNICLSRLVPGDAAPDTAFLAPPTIYKKKFAINPSAIKNTGILAEKLVFQEPDFGIVMPPLKNNTGLCADELLYQKTLQGAKIRYGTSLPCRVIERINHELTIIRQKNFCEYFLVVQKIVKKASHICGRGSGAASIVAYCLGITNVCPIKYDLYFERFLNPDRKDPPDIDIDFAWDERDKILSWVMKEFKGHSAMVSSHILFQPRMAVRETARVFGLPEMEISKISRRLPWFWQLSETGNDLLDRIKQRPESRFMDFPRPWPQIMDYARHLIGIPRTLSVHPGGIIITPDPVDTYVPVETTPKGVPIIQWEKNGTEQAGLVKIDLLGNRSLGVIRDSISSIRLSHGKFDDFTTLDPEDDYETRQTVAMGNTMGCFYIESPAMRLLQKKSRKGDFEHLVIHSSMIRPAANEFITQYLKRLHAGMWKPIHPLLGTILNDTFGIMVFQEDVSKVAVQIAGFTPAAADGLRKIMSKKTAESNLKDYYTRFQKGAAAKGVSLKDIQRIWAMITSFSGYSFCKPHSASYARVSFQAAYLKTHFPAEFMAAVISNQGGFYSTFAYVSEARRIGVRILNPDIHKSDIQWTGHRFTIRVGLSAIKGLSASTMNAIITQRKKALFSDPDDFFCRVLPGENEVQALIHSGSLDTLDKKGRRVCLLWAFFAWKNKKKDMDHHPGLFDHDHLKPGLASAALPDLPASDPIEKLRREFFVLGFLCGGHPILLFKDIIQACNTVKAKDLLKFAGQKIRFAGWLITGKLVKTRQGNSMKFLTFEDETGIVETVFFPKSYAMFCHMLDYDRPYLIDGKLESDFGVITLIVEKARALNIRV